MISKRSLILLGAILGVGIISVFFLLHHNIMVETDSEWAIGIYTGKSPSQLSARAGVSNPVVTPADVMDVNASFVADPFLLRLNSTWYMFYEVFDSLAGKGVVGLSESADGLAWKYKGIVLRENFHLSYPYVFDADGVQYMIPESAEAHGVRLYQATDFPFKWKFVKNLLDGDFADTSLIKYKDLWWMFTCTESKTSDKMRLFYSESLFGPWVSHPQNPIVDGDSSRARPGGRVLALGDHILRFAQDDSRTYGKAVRAFQVTELTTTSYKEIAVQPDPVLAATGRGWTRHGMHHVSAVEVAPDEWLAAVDGYKKTLRIQLEY